MLLLATLLVLPAATFAKDAPTRPVRSEASKNKKHYAKQKEAAKGMWDAFVVSRRLAVGPLSSPYPSPAHPGLCCMQPKRVFDGKRQQARAGAVLRDITGLASASYKYLRIHHLGAAWRRWRQNRLPPTVQPHWRQPCLALLC